MRKFEFETCKNDKDVNCIYRTDVYPLGLSRAITKLEKQGLPIYDALEIFANVRNEMDAAIGEIADQIRNKFNNVVSSNIGLETIAQICQILSGHDTE
uniref:Uncharacterized protein n=1 Tax=Meloidogyne floridensis TaxID=298350 RepID=A0A915PA92_9BILA